MSRTKQRLRTYSELIEIPDFKMRYEYLKIGGSVGVETFGYDRFINQMFYTSPEWKRVRDIVIARDNGCDLGMRDRPIGGRVFIHHMNPIDAESIEHHDLDILDPEYLICASFETHNAIHYGDHHLLILEPTVRTPNDTCPWRNHER